MEQLKEYSVHVIERKHGYTTIQASSKGEAEDMVLKKYNNGDFIWQYLELSAFEAYPAFFTRPAFQEILKRICDPDQLSTLHTFTRLITFNPITSYPAYTGMENISSNTHRCKVGHAKNLIQQMTKQGASVLEVERAVRYFLVILDAEKHFLDHEKAYGNYGIFELTDRYIPKKVNKQKGDFAMQEVVDSYHIEVYEDPDRVLVHHHLCEKPIFSATNDTASEFIMWFREEIGED